MLESLDIREFALIENVRVEWTPGLNILTGETGAGKSIIIDALNAVLGGKAGASFIRTGAEKASIEASFKTNPLIAAWLKKQELIDEELSTLVVSREITKSGSRIRINGTLVNSAIVQELSQLLLTIHAQHEARTLMSPQSQLEMLDSLGDQPHRKLLEKVRTLWSRRKELVAQIKELDTTEDERLRRLDFIRFQLTELNEAQLTDADEDEELSKQKKVLANVAQLSSAAALAYEVLMGGESSDSSTIDMLQTSLAEVERGARLDQELNEPADLLKQSLANIEEAARHLRRYGAGLDTDPEALSNVEARLAVLASIKRKYGPELTDAIANQARLAEEVDKLENAQTATEGLQEELAALDAALNESASELSNKRQKLGKKLSEQVLSELIDLGMERCKFEIKFDATPEVTSTGADRAEFLIAPNPGQPLLPLAKIASGGELSRVMLAVKSIFASADGVSTVIFDEIDTGLSGRVLQAMRDKLARLAKSHQILCITHQPIIASVADNHIEVQKEHSKDLTKVYARQLDADQRLRSLASMASGQEDAEVALNFARSLMEQANHLRA
ncbi:MAG: DNA repair protein RecN [Candidatus Melainabacteria bacterium]|nr:MAG: DNA repair protein RecN [Candidatus Melainabacteria bacterium]